MRVEDLIARFVEHGAKPSLAGPGGRYTYGDLHAAIQQSGTALIDMIHWRAGTVALVVADHAPAAVVAIVTLWAAGHVAVPCAADRADIQALITESEAEVVIDLRRGVCSVTHLPRRDNHELIERLRRNRRPGLILFTSGTTGTPKAAVHDVEVLLERFVRPGRQVTRLLFLGVDHTAGLETVFYTLATGGFGVFPSSRRPSDVCRAIEEHRIQVLAVSPTFLNLLLLDRSYLDYDLRSLEYITYGSEVMSESTLQRCSAAFPSAKIRQNYGTTEVGALSGQSRAGDSRWLKLDSKDCDVRIVDDILHVRSRTAMLGYLNAPNPFTEEGWYNTQDIVERDGDYIRIVGRASDVINVGGSKVFPAEVENIILQVDGVVEALVHSMQHPLLGQVVCATVQTADTVDHTEDFATQIRIRCLSRLEKYKVPMRIFFTTAPLATPRFKKVGRQGLAAPRAGFPQPETSQEPSDGDRSRQ